MKCIVNRQSIKKDENNKDNNEMLLKGTSGKDNIETPGKEEPFYEPKSRAVDEN